MTHTLTWQIWFPTRLQAASPRLLTQHTSKEMLVQESTACVTIEGYNTASNVLEVADAETLTTAELAFCWENVHQNARQRTWVVSPQGWGSVIAIATEPQAGAVVTDSVRATIYGSLLWFAQRFLMTC